MRELLTRYRNVKSPVRHGLYKAAEIVGGGLFLSRAGQAIWHHHLQRMASRQPPPVAAAVVAHVYYPELLDEILQCWRACPPATALHITTPATNVALLQARFADDANVHIHSALNRGRDIAPFLALLQSGALDPFDAVLKLHTKRSVHLLTGEHRRRLLFTALGGNRLQINRILAQFAEPSAGMVGWGASLRTSARHWGENEQRCRDLMQRLGIEVSSLPRQALLSYFEGSMFWFRPAAFQPLRDLNLAASDFEAEAGQVDGALHHAIERIFTWSAARAGFEVRSIRGNTVLALPK